MGGFHWMSQAAFQKDSAADLISAEKLTSLTGLTDRRHRQLADEGFFPKPVEGEYQRDATIRGVLRFYREWKDRAAGDLAGEKLAKLRTERMIAELKLEQQRGEVIPLDEMGDYVARLAAKWEQLLKLKLETEAPPKLIGKNIVEMRRELTLLHDEIRDICNSALDEWKPPEN
jgi:hypothetical protein